MAALQRRRGVTQERLKELFRYDPTDGSFTRLTSHVGYKKGRVLLGTVTKCGHRRIVVDMVGYFVHNLAWLYVTGEWPEPFIDHKDGDGLNNRWSNLREATQTQNNANMRKRQGTVSRFKGVAYVPSRKTKKWQAQIKQGERCYFLGRFVTEAEAADAYRLKAVELYGEFARPA